MNIRKHLTENGITDTAFIKTINDMKKMADKNDHNGVAIAGVKLMNKVSGNKYKKTLSVLKHLEEIQKIYGSMPYELGQHRFTIVKQMWDEASQYMSPDQVTTFTGIY